MKSVKFFLIMIMVTSIAGISENVDASSQSDSECVQGSICLHNGDSLTYSTKFGDVSTTDTYTFGSHVGTNKINFIITSVTSDNKIQSKGVLDLETGFYNETTNDIGYPIIVLHPIPIIIDKNNADYSEKIQNFSNSQRIVVAAAHSANESSGEEAFDKATGVLLYLHLTNHPPAGQTTLEHGVISEIRYDLIDTNIFAISGHQDELQIPTWIKNNAKWWSQGQLADSEFIQGIQYLINQEILKVPKTESSSNQSQQIPSWVKTNAGWWADGQISDDDFVKGIQYLASNGMIHV